MHQVFAFVEFFVSPLFFAVGLVLLLNGIINYFIIGPNFEEGRREKGRQCLLWATSLFLIGLILFSVAHWLLSFTNEMKERVDVDVRTGTDVLRVPNTPGL